MPVLCLLVAHIVTPDLVPYIGPAPIPDKHLERGFASQVRNLHKRALDPRIKLHVLRHRPTSPYDGAAAHMARAARRRPHRPDPLVTHAARPDALMQIPKSLNRLLPAGVALPGRQLAATPAVAVSALLAIVLAWQVVQLVWTLLGGPARGQSRRRRRHRTDSDTPGCNFVRHLASIVDGHLFGVRERTRRRRPLECAGRPR